MRLDEFPSDAATPGAPGVDASDPAPSSPSCEGAGLARSPFLESWIQFDVGLGLTEYLLPVVADHSIAPAPSSKVKALGKVPGRVVASGAVGFPKWTEHTTTPKEIERWMRDERLGLCVRTARVRALDIDVDDPRAAEIGDAFTRVTGALPMRFRPNSHKRLLAFIVEGDLCKRSFKVADGLVELLAGGQQFIVDSIHPSGVRYEWKGGLPAEIPAIAPEKFEEAWAAIVERFALPGTAYEASARRRGDRLDTNDPTADHLIENGLVLGGDDETLWVRCPWADDHSGESGPSESAWLVAGTQGYALGHFRCLHASCAKRTDDEFREAVGCGVSQDFEALPAEPSTPTAKPAGLIVNGDGSFGATLSNLTYALAASGWTGVDVGFDEFLGEVMFCAAGSRHWRVLGDDDRAELRLSLERIGFRPIKREDLRDAVRIVARKNKFDSAQQWLDGLKWDGEPRVETFLVEHFGTEDSRYTRAVSRYWWTAQAARILHPGCQVDMVPVLVSPEGRYKSTTLQALVPSLEHFTEIDLATGNADLSRQMRGKLLGELGELKGLNKRETADLKAKITSRFEEWRPLYAESTVRYLRRLVFVGTTNEEQFMTPAIGERRWLPVAVAGADPLKLAAVRDQLWAESTAIVHARVTDGARGEVEWEAAYDLARHEREKFEPEDPWTTAVDHWLESAGPEAQEFTTDLAFCAIFSAFDRVARNPTPNEQSRMAAILKSRGFKQVRKHVKGRKRRVWTTGGPEREAINGPA